VLYAIIAMRCRMKNDVVRQTAAAAVDDDDDDGGDTVSDWSDFDVF